MPKTQRRSLTETFDPLSSPEARAFVQAGGMAPAAIPAPQTESQSAVVPSKRKASSVLGNTSMTPPSHEGLSTTPVVGEDPLTTVTFRLPAKLVARLLRASANRKIGRIKPWTQQEITAEALNAWLEQQSK